MAAGLKVYRTAIGFHDAYVAAPSQKAALAAWGTDKPLFARGAAEIVTDPALTAEPLASPGTVVKRLRGTEAEQLAALPPDRPEPRRSGTTAAPRRPAGPKRAPPPKPSRAGLDAAEQALREVEGRHRAEREAIARQERALRDERQALERRQDRERQERADARDAAADAYAEALRRWRG